MSTIIFLQRENKNTQAIEMRYGQSLVVEGIQMNVTYLEMMIPFLNFS